MLPPAATKSEVAIALRANAAGGPPAPEPITEEECRAPPPLTAATTATTTPPPAPEPSGGQAAAAAVARFYGRALAPTALLVLWMFVIFAALAYVIPHVVCADAVSAEATAGFKACVKPSRAGYAALAMPSKVLLTVIWAALSAWLAVYVGLMGAAMFPTGFTKPHAAAVAGTALILAAAFGAAPALGKGLDDAAYVIAPIPVALVTTLLVGHALTRATGDPLDLLRWFAMMTAAAVAVLVYMIYMPEIITRRSLGKPWHLLAARMVAHPFIWTAITALFAHTGRYVGRTGPLMHATMFVWPAMYASIFGRFLLLQLDTAGSVAALNVQLALVGIAGRLGGRGGAWPHKIMYGGRAAEAVEAGKDAAQLRVTRWVVDLMAEHAGIVCSAALYTFGAVSPRAVWTTALWQAFTVLAADGAGLAIDWAFHGADPRAEWPAPGEKGLGRYLAFMAVLVTVGGARIALELIMLFCPTTAPGVEGGGVLLSYCNKPSLFDKM